MIKGNLFVIFGGSGNLAHLKLYPALYNLYHKDKLPEDFAIVSVASSKKSTEIFQEEIKYSLEKYAFSEVDEKWEGFKKLIHYFPLNFKNREDYKELKTTLNNLNRQYHTNNNKVFYLATSPTFFKTIADNLSRIEMLNKTDGYQRLVFEKPFGTDYTSAKDLNDSLSNFIKEKDIFRIDHYLGKDMVQNIMYLRFSNIIFENVWNNEFIDNIQITASETIGVDERGRYFDNSGTLRDMIQNHLLQVLAITTMDLPKDFEANAIIDEKVKIFKNLNKFNEKTFKDNLVLGQYKKNKAKDIKGYREEEDIPSDSKTETFVALKTSLNTERWKDVPIYLKTGKRLDQKELFITIEFKNTEKLSRITDKSYKPNIIRIKIHPEEGVNLQFNLKKPVADDELVPVNMDFCKSCLSDFKSPKAYEKIILGIFKGTSSLFSRWDEVEYTWKFIDSITDCCDDNKEQLLTFYEAGTSGPKKADELLTKDGRKWWRYSGGDIYENL